MVDVLSDALRALSGGAIAAILVTLPLWWVMVWIPWAKKRLWTQVEGTWLAEAGAVAIAALTTTPVWTLLAATIPDRVCTKNFSPSFPPTCTCPSGEFNHLFVEWLETNYLFVPYEVAVTASALAATAVCFLLLRAWRKQRLLRALELPQEAAQL